MKKDFVSYPIIIEKHPTKKNDYGSYFVDFETCFSGGDTIQETIENSKEALALHYLSMESDGDFIPEPTDPKDIKLKEGQVLAYVNLNLKWASEKDKHKSITKAVTLPKWLNQKAIESGINVSSVLQKALIEALEEPK